MSRIVTFVLAIALVAGVAYYALGRAGGSSSPTGEARVPTRQLDAVRQAASRSESEAEQRARDLEEKLRQGAQ
jgi:hypothetical protein